MYITAFRHDTDVRQTNAWIDGQTDSGIVSVMNTHALCGENGVIAAKQNKKIIIALTIFYAPVS